MHGSGAVSCSCSLLIRGPILPAVRQKLHLSPCADSRSRLWESFAIGPQSSVSVGGPDGSANFDGANYTIERLARFRRCCRFRSFHLAFWLLLSFARDALVHLNAIGRSVAAVGERPDPPRARDGPGLGHAHRLSGRAQMTN